MALELLTGLTQANLETGFLVDICVLKTMIYCLNRVSLRKSCPTLWLGLWVNPLLKKWAEKFFINIMTK